MKDELKDKLSEINNFNFSTNEEFNIEEKYKTINELQTYQTESKYIDAEVKIKKAVEYNIVSDECFKDIENYKQNLFSFMRKYDPNTDYIKNLDEENKSRLFAIAKHLLTEYGNKLNNIKFNYKMSYKEIHFLNNVLTRKLEYDGNDIFTYTELKVRYWNSVQEILEKLKAKEEDALFEIDITSITYLNHLIMKHKVKGSNEEYILFRDILYKLNELNDIFNCFKILYDRINTNFTIWTTSITESK